MLHAGAKYVMDNFGGVLPSTTEELLTIPGIGPYTAGAISSIAFGNREPLVDGNVIRVVARLRAVGADPKNKQLINFSWCVPHCFQTVSSRRVSLTLESVGKRPESSLKSVTDQAI
ncbi:hypothetical protein PINS_up009784 [Pythium insidiosum]|nr:hypothetical protein PINS_up009784 [Pythium insidiosum]